MRRGADLYLEAALLADEAGVVNAPCVGWLSAGSLPQWVGPLAEGHEGLDRVVELSGGDPNVGADLYGYSPLARSFLSRAELLVLTGQLDHARREADRAVALTRERSEAETLAWTLSIYPRLGRTGGEAEDVLKHATEAVRIADDIGNPAVRVTPLAAVGIAEVELGRFGEAADLVHRPLRGPGAPGRPVRGSHPAHPPQPGSPRTGERAAAREAADEAVAVAHRQGARVTESLALLTRARVRQATGAATGEVEADLAAALVLARETGATAYEREIEAENNS